jgi:alcohol dehydrogenase class IV
MRYLAPATAERQALIAQALGVDTSGMTGEEPAEAAARALEALIDDLGLPRRLSQVGVEPSAYDDIAAAVMADLVVAGSPIAITHPGQVVGILQKAS